MPHTKDGSRNKKSAAIDGADLVEVNRLLHLLSDTLRHTFPSKRRRYDHLSGLRRLTADKLARYCSADFPALAEFFVSPAAARLVTYFAGMTNE
jgi:hypothetical protein